MADRYIRCSFCGRSIRVRLSDGVLYKHDNRNHSGWCKGSLMFVAPVESTPHNGGHNRDGAS